MVFAWKKAFALTLLTLPMAECLAICDSEWAVNGDGNWGVTTNWIPNCSPQMPGDIATLGLFPIVPVTVNLDISPTITSLTFNNQNGYTIFGTLEQLNFAGATAGGPSTINLLSGSGVLVLDAPVFLDNTALTINIKGSPFGEDLFFKKGILPGSSFSMTINGPTSPNNPNIQGDVFNDSGILAAPSIIHVPELILNSENLIFGNTTDHGTLNGQGSTVLISGDFIQNGAEVDNFTHADVITGQGSTFQANNFTINSGLFSNGTFGSSADAGSVAGALNDMTINGGRVISLNQGTVSGPMATGSLFSIENNLTMNGGTLTNLNGPSGVVTGFGNTGCALQVINGLFTLNKGTVENFNESSSIDPLFNSGAFIQMGDFVIKGGSFSNKNTGSLTASLGAFAFLGGEGTISGGSLDNTNTANLTGGTGARINFGGIVKLSNATLTNTNQGNISGISGITRGVDLDFFSDGTMAGGSITNTNNGNISGTTGSQIDFKNFTLNGGTIDNINNGQISNNAVGALFQTTFNKFQMTAGTITNNNTGKVASDGSIGSLIRTGDFTITGGKLINNDTFQSHTVSNQGSGIISGIGLFQGAFGSPGTLFTNGATVIPGNSPGIMTIEGTYTQTPSGTLVITLSDKLSSELVVKGVTGQAHLNGTLEVLLSDQAKGFPGHHITILEASGGVFGTFATIDNDLPSTLLLDVRYFPHSVELTLDPTITDYIGGFTQALFTTVNQINNRLGWQMESIKRRMPKWDPCACCGPDTHPWEIYIGPVGSVGDLRHAKDQIGADFNSIGGLIGVDYATCQFGVGLEADYERIHGHGNDSWGKFDIDEAHASLYATYVPTWQPELAVNAIVGGGYEWYSIHRHTHVGHVVAKGSPRGCEFDALFGIEYDISMECNPFHFVPLANVQYIRLNIDDYTEHGAGGLNMKIGHQDAKSLRSTLGLRSNYIWECEDFLFIPEISLGWQREFLDKGRDVEFTPVFFDLSGSSLQMAHAGRNIWMGGIDLLATFCNTYSFEASYDFEWNKRYTNNFFYLGFKLSF